VGCRPPCKLLAPPPVAAPKPTVILNLFQDPFLIINGSLIGKMDPETSSG
jgi:hypothetical protein